MKYLIVFLPLFFCSCYDNYNLVKKTCKVVEIGHCQEATWTQYGSCAVRCEDGSFADFSNPMIGRVYEWKILVGKNQ